MHRFHVKTCGQYLGEMLFVAVCTCQRWFTKFRSGDISLEEDSRSGLPSKINDEILRTMLENNPYLTTREIANEFGVHCSGPL